MISPKSNWRFPNPRSDVLSSTIQEVCSEEDSPNSSISSFKYNPDSLRRNKGNIVPGPISPLPIVNRPVAEVTSPVNQFMVKSPSMKDNIFLKTEENNFMKSELTSFSLKSVPPSYSMGMGINRAQYIQDRRAQFLGQTQLPDPSQVTAQFKNGHYTGQKLMSSPQKSDPFKEVPKQCPSPPTLETAL